MESYFKLFFNEGTVQKKPVCIFDFDHTLCRNHIHILTRNLLNSLFANGDREALALFKDKINPETSKLKFMIDQEEVWSPVQQDYIWNLLKSAGVLVPTGTKEEWQSIFRTLIADHYPIYIATFSSFKFVVELFLKDPAFGLGLSQEEASAIHILACLPSREDDKNLHLFHILLQEDGKLNDRSPFKEILKIKERLEKNSQDNPIEDKQELSLWEKECQRLLEKIKFVLFDDTDRNTEGMKKLVQILLYHASPKEQLALEKLLDEMNQSSLFLNREEADTTPHKVEEWLKSHYHLSFLPTLKNI